MTTMRTFGHDQSARRPWAMAQWRRRALRALASVAVGVAIVALATIAAASL